MSGSVMSAMTRKVPPHNGHRLSCLFEVEERPYRVTAVGRFLPLAGHNNRLQLVSF